MTRWLRPAELAHQRERDQFDPVGEGARLLLSPEIALAIWERVCTDATDQAGRCDAEEARRRFGEIAARIAARGGRLRPDVGRMTRVSIEFEGDTPHVSAAEELAIRAPGRETLVATEARRWTRQNRELAVTLESSQGAGYERDAEPISQRELPGASEVMQAMAALRDPVPPEEARLQQTLWNTPARLPFGDSLPVRYALGHEREPLASPRQLTPSALELVSPELSIDARFRLAEGGALQEVMLLALHALASDRLSDRSHVQPALFSSSLRSPATRESSPLRRPHHAMLGLFASFGKSSRSVPTLDPAWRVSGGAILTDVVQRRAATIFRRELADASIDLHDPAIQEALERAGQGEPLPEPVRREMEARLGADFRHVRVHTDAVAARAADALHASAFTLGTDIFFAAGAYAPVEESGQRLLVHELTHVIQSQQGRVPVSNGPEVSRPTDGLEQEATAAYDRTAARHQPQNELSQNNSLLPKSHTLLRAPASGHGPKSPVRDASWLSWDAKLVISFVDGFARGTGKGFTPEMRAKIKRDFTDPASLAAMYMGVQLGVPEGALRDLGDNIAGLAKVAEWVFWNATPVGLQLQQAKDVYEWVTDPTGKAAKEQEKHERQKAFLEGMWQLAQQLAKDPGVIADLGEEVGEVAGDHVARSYGVAFADARPLNKGRMIGIAIGYIAMEIALLFVGPELLVAKVPAAVAKIARAGGKAATAILRLMEKIPALRKLLKAAGWLEKLAGPEAKLLAHLDAAIITKVSQEGLKADELARLAKLDKAAAEKLLSELPARDVLDLEKKLGKMELEKLAKDKTGKEIQEIAAQATSRPAFSKADAEDLLVSSEGRPGPGKNVGHAEDHVPPEGATDAEARLLAQTRPSKANNTTFRSRRQATQILRDIMNEQRAAIDALPADGVTLVNGTKLLSPQTVPGFNSQLGGPATLIDIRSVSWGIVRLNDGQLHLVHFAPRMP